MERFKDFFQAFSSFRVNQIPIAIELLWWLASEDEQLGLVDEMDVEENSDLAQMELHPRSSGTSGGRNNGCSLVGPNVGGSRSPIKSILQWGWQNINKQEMKL